LLSEKFLLMLSKLTPMPAAAARNIDRVNGSSWPSGAFRSGTVTLSPGCKILEDAWRELTDAIAVVDLITNQFPFRRLVMNPINALAGPSTHHLCLFVAMQHVQAHQRRRKPRHTARLPWPL
jgi:hypothetical protein